MMDQEYANPIIIGELFEGIDYLIVVCITVPIPSGSTDFLESIDDNQVGIAVIINEVC